VRGVEQPHTRDGVVQVHVDLLFHRTTADGCKKEEEEEEEESTLTTVAGKKKTRSWFFASYFMTFPNLLGTTGKTLNTHDDMFSMSWTQLNLTPGCLLLCKTYKEYQLLLFI